METLAALAWHGAAGRGLGTSTPCWALHYGATGTGPGPERGASEGESPSLLPTNRFHHITNKHAIKGTAQLCSSHSQCSQPARPKARTWGGKLLPFRRGIATGRSL